MAGDAGDFGGRAAGDAEPGEALAPADVLCALAGIEDGLGDLATRGAWFQASKDQLEEALLRTDRVRQQLDRLRYAVTAEVTERGLYNDNRLTLPDYLAGHSPWASRREVTTEARVVDRLREGKNRVIREAVRTGSLSMERAAALLRSMGRLAPFVDLETYVRKAEILLPLAQLGADKELRTATEHLVALVTPELSAEHLAKARAESCKVYESSLSGGMRRFIIEADPEGAATLDAIFGSVLTKPVPTADGEDTRTPGRRRYDALMTVLDRGMSHPEGVPTSAKVSLMVTVDYDLLAERVGRGGHSVGTTGSSFFTAGQVRKMGCQAGIVPAVLGGDSQLLDLGRTRRLATPAQLRALYRRDRGCTYPGCTMPAVWCEAHHADMWWSQGGTTDIGSLALLCRRHHSWVHAWDPEVTTTGTRVVWHLDRLRGRGFLKAKLHTDGRRKARRGPPSGSGPGWAGALGGSCETGPADSGHEQTASCEVARDRAIAAPAETAPLTRVDEAEHPVVHQPVELPTGPGRVPPGSDPPAPSRSQPHGRARTSRREGGGHHRRGGKRTRAP